MKIISPSVYCPLQRINAVLVDIVSGVRNHYVFMLRSRVHYTFCKGLVVFPGPSKKHQFSPVAAEVFARESHGSGDAVLGVALSSCFLNETSVCCCCQ